MNKKAKAGKSSNRQNLFLIVVLILVIIGSLCLLSCENSAESNIPKEIATSKNQSDFASILKEDETNIVAAFYPIIQNEAIMTDLRDVVHSCIEQFKNDQNKIYYLDYDIYYVSDQYVSVAFLSSQADELTGLQLALDQTITYDLANGQKVELADLFKDDYLKALATLLRITVKQDLNLNYRLHTDLYRNTKDDLNNFSEFVLDNDQLIVFYDSNKLINEDLGLIKINFSLKDLNYYLKNSLLTNPIIKPTDMKNRMLRYIDADQPMIALTYDDGPYGKVTDQIIETLYENDSVATFFIVGSRIKKYPETIKTMINNGNEIGNHSYTHKYILTQLNISHLNEEINFVQRDLDRYVGDYQISLLRPIGGRYNQFLKDNCDYPIINWSIDAKDWLYHSSMTTYEEVVNHAKDGDIVLMHDLFQSTADATNAIVPKLIEMGYQLVTVSELLEYKGIDPQVGQVYFSSYSKAK